MYDAMLGRDYLTRVRNDARAAALPDTPPELLDYASARRSLAREYRQVLINTRAYALEHETDQTPAALADIDARLADCQRVLDTGLCPRPAPNCTLCIHCPCGR